MAIKITGGLIEAFADGGSPWLAGPDDFGAGGFFETMRIESRRVRFFEAHWGRLTRALEHWRLAPPCGRDRMLEALAAEVGRHPRDAVLRARVVVVPAPGAAADEEPIPTQAWVMASPVTGPMSGALGQRPAARLALPEGLRVASGAPLNGFKTTQRHLFWEARRRARRAGFDDALLLNERGELVETATANILWARGDALFTPAAATGALPGVVAVWLIQRAREAGITTHEVHEGPEALDGADAVMVTNSLVELGEVAAVGEKKCGTEKKSAAMGRLIGLIEQSRESIANVALD